MARDGEKTRIWIVDDHQIVRQGLRALLETEPGFEVVAEASTEAEALAQAEHVECDVAVVDLRLRGGDGLRCIATLQKRRPSVPILVLTMHESPRKVLEAVRAGARGYLVKSVGREEFVAAVRAVRDGGSYFHSVIADPLLNRLRSAEAEEPPLTDRELKILRMVACGMRNRDIARTLDISVAMVKVTLSTLFTRLGVSDRTQLVVEAIDAGLFPS